MARSRLTRLKPSGKGSLTLAGRRFHFAGYARNAALSEVTLLFAKSGLILGVRETDDGLRVEEPYHWVSAQRIKAIPGGYAFEGHEYEAQSTSTLEPSIGAVPRPWETGATLTWARRRRRPLLGVITGEDGAIVGAVTRDTTWIGWLDVPESAYRTRRQRARDDKRALIFWGAIAVFPFLVWLVKPSTPVFAFGGVGGGVICLVLAWGGLIGLRGQLARSERTALRALKIAGWSSTMLLFGLFGLTTIWGGLHPSRTQGVVIGKRVDTSGRSNTYLITLDVTGEFDASRRAYGSVQLGDRVDCVQTNPILITPTLYRCDVLP